MEHALSRYDTRNLDLNKAEQQQQQRSEQPTVQV